MSGFSFTPPSGNSNLFGGGSNTPKTTGGLFGSTPATSVTTQAGGLFSGGATTGGASPFGAPKTDSAQQPGGLFSSSKLTSGASTPSMFGGSSGTAPSTGFSFGAANPASTSAPASTSSSTAFSNGGFSFTQLKKDESSTLGSAQGLFGNLSKPSSGPSLFAPANTTTSTSGSSTPAPSKPPFSLSTTPAGPPPAVSNSGSTTLFGSNAQKPLGALFGASASKPGETATTPTTSGPGLFGGISTTPSTAAPKTNTFGGLNVTPSSGTSTTPRVAPTASTAQPSMFNFPPTSSSTQAISAPSLGGLFANKAPGSTATTAAPLFGTTLNSTSNASAPTTSTTTAAPGLGSLFGNTPAKTSAPVTSGTPATGSTAPATTSSATTTKNQTAGATNTNNQSQSFGGANLPATSTNAAAPLGASTSGPSPQLSRLKNKTMDEIITRWASDLSKYQNEFQDQAIKVAEWDRLLVENGDKIQKLHNSTAEAMRAGGEIERQLATVESQQDELAAWLDRYEQDVDEMFSRQVGPGETLQGPDQERERTYKLAEKLADRLDEMGKDLSNMIEAINEASANLNRNNKPDDPLSHIVRVLNSHLTQLQWIDQNTKALQEKVDTAQKLGQSVGANGFGGAESEAADHFYRSFIGSRR